MILRVLGCSGSEFDGEHHGSYLVDSRVLFDLGCCAAALSLEEQCAVSDVFVTHSHLDHTKDLGFLAENVFGRRTSPVRVRGTPKTLETIRRHLLNGEVWPDFSTLPSVEVPTIVYSPLGPDETVRLDGLSVTHIQTEHMPGSSAFQLASSQGAILFSGDCGAGDPFFTAIRDAGAALRGVVVEVTFPNRLEKLARAARHLTPGLLAAELAAIPGLDVPVHICHVKGTTRAETLREIAELGDRRLRVLSPGSELEF